MNKTQGSTQAEMVRSSGARLFTAHPRKRGSPTPSTLTLGPHLLQSSLRARSGEGAVFPEPLPRPPEDE